MSKQKEYVVVDWGAWGIDVQLSSKIVVKDHLNVKKGDGCSLQGTDPVTKRPIMFEGEVLGVFGTKKDAEKLVTALVNPSLAHDGKGKEVNVDAPRPRREPKPSRKVVEGNDESENSEAPTRKKNRKESPTEKTTEVLQKNKNTSKKKKGADPTKDDEIEIIAVANANRVQSLLLRRKNASAASEEVETVKVTAENKTNHQSDSNHMSKVQPSDAVVPAPPHSKPLPVDLSQQSEILTYSQTPLSAKNQNGERTLFPPRPSSNFSSTAQSSSQFIPASPVTPAPRFQFSTPTMGLSQSTSSSSSLSHSSMPSPPQFINNSTQVLSPPTIPQDEFSISHSLGHCSDYDMSDLEVPTGYSSHNISLNQLQTVPGQTPRDHNWQGSPSFTAVNSPCPNCQPLLQSLSSRLSNLESEVEKLRRKQKKGKLAFESEVPEKVIDPNEERFNGHTKEALVKSTEDSSDAKSAVESLAKQLFTADELQHSSVTGFQCNKEYESRPGLSPRRRNVLESIVLKKRFPAATRSSVRKDLGLVLKKARLNKENTKANKKL